MNQNYKINLYSDINNPYSFCNKLKFGKNKFVFYSSFLFYGFYITDEFDNVVHLERFEGAPYETKYKGSITIYFDENIKLNKLIKHK
jgi:hypothetical protein